MRKLFDADDIALGWLSAAVASQKMDDRPIMDRTVCLEFHDNGVRIAATDSVLLLHAWVPCLGAGGQPDADEAPDERVVVFDPDARGIGLLRYARKLCVAADKAEEEHPDLSIEVKKALPRPGGDVSMPGLEGRCVALEMAGAEAVTLDVIDGEYPSWQSLMHQEWEATDQIMFAADRLKQVAQLGKLHGRSVRWRFNGSKLAALEVEDPEIETSGVLMALRSLEAVDKAA